jgi:hypothetical protein
VVVTVAGSLNAFQLEATTFSANGTSLIITGANNVTRATEFVTATIAASGASYTLFGSGLTSDPTSINKFMLTLSDATANNRLSLYSNTSQARCVFVIGGTNTFAANLSAVTANTTFKMAATHATNDQAAAANGGAISSSTTAATLSGLTALNFGAQVTGGVATILNGYIDRIAVWLTHRASNSELQRISGT